MRFYTLNGDSTLSFEGWNGADILVRGASTTSENDLRLYEPDRNENENGA